MKLHNQDVQMILKFLQISIHVHGFVTVNGEKMSKSLGNTKSIKHVLENWGANKPAFSSAVLESKAMSPESEEMLKEGIAAYTAMFLLIK